MEETILSDTEDIESILNMDTEIDLNLSDLEEIENFFDKLIENNELHDLLKNSDTDSTDSLAEFSWESEEKEKQENFDIVQDLDKVVSSMSLDDIPEITIEDIEKVYYYESIIYIYYFKKEKKFILLYYMKCNFTGSTRYRK